MNGTTQNRITHHSSDVIVIGAGMAGLGAARKIADAGRSVIALEARDRIGGRLWTDRTSMGAPVELGAELVHGAEASTWNIITAQDLPTHRLTQQLARRGPGERWIPHDDPELWAFPGGRPILPDPLPLPLPDETALTYLSRVGVAPGNVPLALRLVEVDTEQLHALAASDIVELLLVANDVAETAAAPSADSADFRVPGGYDSVPSALATGLDIRTGTVVREVRSFPDRVEVVTSEQTFVAQAAVLAVPAGVLQSGTIGFSPALPAGRQERIDAVTYLPVYKGLFEFASPVLPSGWDVIEDPSLPVPCFWNASAGIPDYAGEILVAWATGDNARRMLALDPSEQQATALTSLSSMLGGAPDLTPVAAMSHDWAADPFARGAYPGPSPLPEGLYEPLDGRVFWAGIVTETVHESFDSGQEAGRQALSMLRERR